MSSMVWLFVFATLLSLASCQSDRPTPGPIVEQCVQQAATQDSFLEECLQVFTERENDPTTLAIYCNSQCVSDLVTAYTDCNAQDTRFVTQYCDEGSFTQTILNAEFCVSQEVATTSLLQLCQRQLFTDFVYRDNSDVPIENFCTNCGQAMATLYGNCGPAVDRSSRLNFGPTLGEVFQGGCAQDSMGRYCSDVVRDLGQGDRRVLEEAAILACENIGDECTQACRDAINELGCCAHLEQLFRRRNDPMLPLELCGITECPVPFSIDPAPQCNGGVSLSVSLLSLVVVVLTLLWSASS